MTITFAIVLTVVLTLSSVYLIWQWRTGALRDEADDDHECCDQGYDQGVDEGDEIGFTRGREIEKAERTDPLNEILQGIADLLPSRHARSNMEADDWQAIAEEMYEKAVAAP